jgi:hypothetical protein
MADAYLGVAMNLDTSSSRGAQHVAISDCLKCKSPIQATTFERVLDTVFGHLFEAIGDRHVLRSSP